MPSSVQPAISGKPVGAATRPAPTARTDPNGQSRSQNCLRPDNALHLTPPQPLAQRSRKVSYAVSQVRLAVWPHIKTIAVGLSTY